MDLRETLYNILYKMSNNPLMCILFVLLTLPLIPITILATRYMHFVVKEWSASLKHRNDNHNEEGIIMLPQVTRCKHHSMYVERKLEKNDFRFIENMLLSNKIRLQDIPRKIRVTSRSFYIAALRISRNISVKRYREDVNTLANDIRTMPDSLKKRDIALYYESIKKYKPSIVKQKL